MPRSVQLWVLLWSEEENTMGQRRTQYRQCSTSNSTIRASAFVLRANTHNLDQQTANTSSHTRATTNAPPSNYDHQTTSISMQKNCAPFLYARRTSAQVGDVHVDSENGIPSSYVSALMPRARNVTKKKKNVLSIS